MTKEIRKLLDELKLHRPGLGFYACATRSRRSPADRAIKLRSTTIMGHVDASMAGAYREKIDDNRLRAVIEPRSPVAVSKTEGKVEFELPGVGSSHATGRVASGTTGVRGWSSAESGAEMYFKFQGKTSIAVNHFLCRWMDGTRSLESKVANA